MLRLTICLMVVTSCIGMESVTDMLRGVNQTDQFVAVLEQAIDEGLLDLSSGGPYTILVPTDNAFSRLSSEEMTKLTSDASKLSDVLKYHVIKGEIFSWDLLNGRVLHTLNGHSLRVYTTGQSTYVDSGHVVKADLEASNAVIHLIDQVLDVPEGTIYAVARSGRYPLSMFADYMDRMHINRTMDTVGQQKFTAFIPSDDAINALPAYVLDALHTNTNYVGELVTYHIHAGTLHLRSLDRNSTVSTLNGRHTITVTVAPDVVLNKIAGLEETDIDCDNGVIHIIDHVLIPSTLGGLIG